MNARNTPPKTHAVTLIASAALALTAVVSTAAVHAQSADATTTATAPAWQHHGRHHPAPFMGALRQLNLSDAQKASIHQIFETRRGTAKAEFASFRSQRTAFAALDPAAPDYQQQVNGFADDAAAKARQRTQDMAQLKAQVIAVLTPEQKAQFLSALANPPRHERFAPPAG